MKESIKHVLYLFTAIGGFMLAFSACSEEPVDPNGGKEEPGTIAVTGVEVNPKSLTIEEGKTDVITVTVLPDNATNKRVVWSSDNTAIATVVDGVVTAVKEGSTNVRVKTEDGEKTASCVVTVKASTKPSVTLDADHISAVSVILAGKANVESVATVECGIIYSTSKTVDLNAVKVSATGVNGDGSYSVTVKGLEPKTTYYYKSFVTTGNKDVCGEVKEFTTKELSTLLKTEGASSISAVSAQVEGALDLTDVQYGSKSAGFYYSTNAESLSGNVSAQENDKKLKGTLKALIPEKEYFYQSYVVLDGKTYKGEVKSFVTKKVSTLIETKDASDVEPSSARLNAGLMLPDVFYDSIEYGFYWGKSKESLNSYTRGGTITDNAYYATITSLSANTQYWFKSYVKIDNQTFFGEVLPFTTGVVRVTSVTLNYSEYTFTSIGNTCSLYATVIPYDATDKTVSWSSSDETVVTVSESGYVKAIGNGTATVTATADGVSANCIFTVSQYITRLYFENTYIYLNAGQTEALPIVIEPENAANKKLKWTSYNESVAQISDEGIVTAIGNGSAQIYAEATDGSGRYAYCYVYVTTKVESIDLDKEELSMYVGKSYTLTATVNPETASSKSVSWTSADPSVATVSSNGTVKAIAEGETAISVTANDGSEVTKSCKVTVRPAVSISMKWASSATMIVGEEETVDITITPNEVPVVWGSSNPAVVSVSEGGHFKALSVGSATVTVSVADENSFYDSCIVSVRDVSSFANNETVADLGLSVLWARYNLDANSETEYGGYYAWGETQTKSAYGASYYKWYSGGSRSSIIKYSSSDNLVELQDADDVAYQKTLGKFRMPTKAEFQELKDNATWTSTTINGVKGYKVTSNVAGYTDRYIFLPCGGRYESNSRVKEGTYGYFWSRTRSTNYDYKAWNYDFDARNLWEDYRDWGYNIRPVTLSASVTQRVLYVGEQVDMVAEGFSSSVDVKWKSLDSSIASVTESGVVTANKVGDAILVARNEDSSEVMAVSILVRIKYSGGSGSNEGIGEGEEI